MPRVWCDTMTLGLKTCRVAMAKLLLISLGKTLRPWSRGPPEHPLSLSPEIEGLFMERQDSARLQANGNLHGKLHEQDLSTQVYGGIDARASGFHGGFQGR